ncbi:reticulon-like protein B12 [Amaranthus tricolor]|uniref:reticulon-like protein B12 n=1 Tax=Amaranthus tricolor TaxID=29722 RepID=UPI00258DF1D8|nr:reticulon-like protein B12 [Amaranthus tricolor]
MAMETTVHELLGGGFVADVVLWRQRNITIGMLMMVLIVWLVFEESGYTLLSLISSVLLLLVTILFVWSKAASLLNRPAPPLPEINLTQEQVAEMGELVRKNINALVLVCRDVALGKDSRLYLRVAAWLLLISIVGGLTDIVSLCYISFVLVLTVPALYERYNEIIDKHMKNVYRCLQRIRVKLDYYIAMLRKLDLEKRQ